MYTLKITDVDRNVTHGMAVTLEPVDDGVSGKIILGHLPNETAGMHIDVPYHLLSEEEYTALVEAQPEEVAE